MKKKLLVLLAGAALVSTVLIGCNEKTSAQSIVKDFGGSMEIRLEPGQKLEEVTWKDDTLWYLTRPMREDEEAEVHTFQQKKTFGLLEGTVTVIETKE